MNDKRVGFNSIDEYIAIFPEDVQKTMSQLRKTIKAAAPEAGDDNIIGLIQLPSWNERQAYFHPEEPATFIVDNINTALLVERMCSNVESKFGHDWNETTSCAGCFL